MIIQESMFPFQIWISCQHFCVLTKIIFRLPETLWLHFRSVWCSHLIPRLPISSWNLNLYLCICVFVHLHVCVFMYLCICISDLQPANQLLKFELYWTHLTRFRDQFNFHIFSVGLVPFSKGLLMTIRMPVFHEIEFWWQFSSKVVDFISISIFIYKYFTSHYIDLMWKEDTKILPSDWCPPWLLHTMVKPPNKNETALEWTEISRRNNLTKTKIRQIQRTILWKINDNQTLQ